MERMCGADGSGKRDILLSLLQKVPAAWIVIRIALNDLNDSEAGREKPLDFVIDHASPGLFRVVCRRIENTVEGEEMIITT